MTISRAQVWRRFWLAAPVVGAVLILAFPRPGSERLVQIRSGAALVAVRDEKVYLRATRPSAYILETPLRGGRARPVASLTGWLSPGDSTIRATFEEARVLFEWTGFSATERTAVPRGPFNGIQGERQGIRAWITEASLHEGRARPLLPELWMDQTAILGEQCYWLRRDPQQQRQTPRDRQDQARTVVPCDLMSTPLDGGPARKLASGLPSTTRLFAGEEHLFWMDTSSPGPRDLYFYRPETHRVERLPGYTGREPPVLLEERFYWQAGAPMALAPSTDHFPPGSLVSARLDGSDMQEVLPGDFPTDPSPQLRLLGVHQGWLYFIEQKPGSEFPGVSRSPSRMLYRIGPARPEEVERLVRLPFESAGYCFDGDSFYFTANEHRESWLNWSPQGLRVRTDQFLYRYRLPP